MTMTAEQRYHTERDGTLYAKDIPISDDEQAICTWILEQQAEDTDAIISILDDIDGGERRRIDVHFDRVIDAVAELPDAQRAQAIALWEGFLAGCATGA
jgi:hypothetical protein